MRGNITKRGKASWRIKFDVGFDPQRAGANITPRPCAALEPPHPTFLPSELLECRRRVVDAALPLATYARHWLTAIRKQNIGEKLTSVTRSSSGSTSSRNSARSKFKSSMARASTASTAHLLTAGRLDGRGGLSPQTVRHIHRLLSQLQLAAKAQKLRRSDDGYASPPKVSKPHIQVLDDDELRFGSAHQARKSFALSDCIVSARNRNSPGRTAGLQWGDIDLRRRHVRVERSRRGNEGGTAREVAKDKTRAA